MAIYLDEDYVGTDPTTIGFPHLLLCMGVVVLTANEIHGVHFVANCNSGHTLAGFAAYLTAQGVVPADMIGLYGACNFNVRYGNHNRKTAWQQEMRDIAAAIGYAGDAKGFDTSIINPTDGTYVEYVRQPLHNRCSIFYKRNEKMDYGPTAQNVHRVNGAGNLVASFGATSATAKPTQSNGGLLHEVNYFLRLKNFTI